MSSIAWLKKQGAKLAIKFTANLTGDVSGKDAAVGGWKMGKDVAEGKPASAGSVRSSPTYNPDKAFDANHNTQWEPAYRVLTWLKVDLEETMDIRGMTGRPAANGAASGFYVDGSNDDVSWHRVHTIDNWSDPRIYGSAAYDIDFGNSHSYRYWRITITGHNGNYPGFSIVKYRKAEPVGNEIAFTVTGEEPLYEKFPRPIVGEEPQPDYGPLAYGNYVVKSVEAHPTEENAILLTMEPTKRFQNLMGDLTIAYDMTIGNLTGEGGAVQSFRKTITPEDLEWQPNPLWEETIKASIANFNLTVIAVMYIVVSEPYPTDDVNHQKEKWQWGEYNREKISVGITDFSITLIHVQDIDP